MLKQRAFPIASNCPPTSQVSQAPISHPRWHRDPPPPGPFPTLTAPPQKQRHLVPSTSTSHLALALSLFPSAQPNLPTSTAII
ncbi:hypothetical protein HYQ45_014330 [Verticillium longisporum]|uniref:Uncharacterized protein n=1 Tax=Verticillium longisporum TaxID=100787 RepID=A0A8I2ZCV6_VERLO|nr:hypothetical protein HYQ45_014330 [Verticillium longisporum]